MIGVTINGEACQLTDDATVDALVEERAPSRRGVAVAVNETVVPRSTWAATRVREGDRIELLRASQGG